MDKNDVKLRKLKNNNSILKTLWLNINYDCNLRCEWCYAKMTGYKKHSMIIETAQKYITMAVQLGADNVVLIGGEPTMHAEILEIIRIAGQAGLRPRLVTNGIKFSDKKFLKEVMNAGLISIAVSVKAPNRQMFLADTQTDLFDRQIKAVQNIVSSGIDYTISITVCKNLVGNFDEMVETIKRTGANKLLIDTGKPIFLNGKFSVDGMSTPKELAQFIIKIYPKFEKSGLHIFLKLALPFCLFPDEFVETMLGSGKVGTGCTMMEGGSLIVSPDGNIIPCNHLCEQSLGKIGKDFLNVNELRELIENGNIAKFHKLINSCPDKQCISCSYWSICGAGCKIYWLHYGANAMLEDVCLVT